MSKTKEEEVAPTSVAANEHTTVTVNNGSKELTTMEQMFQEDAGAGLKNLGADSYSIPFVAILQKGSPQVSRANAKYVKDAQAGQIFNTVSSEIYDGEEGIEFIPCGCQRLMVRWKSRDSGGGLICQYSADDPMLKKFKRDERGRLYDEETKDIVVDTAYHYGVLVHGGDSFPEFAVISMTSTQLKTSRNWNTIARRIMMRGPGGQIFNPPTYSRIYRLTTIGQSKDTFDWFGWKFAISGEVKDVEIYKICREFAKQVESGEVRVSAPPQEFEESSDSTDEVPF